MLEQLIKEIGEYIEFIKNTYGLQISLHTYVNETVISESSLMKYNIHYNSYCLYLKTNPNIWKKCIAHQSKVIDRCKNGPFFGMCYAGTEEFVIPVFWENQLKCFISISGYRTSCEGKKKAAWISEEFSLDLQTTLHMYENGLTSEIPDKSLIDNLVRPLTRMLEYAYSLCAKTIEQDNRNLYNELLHYINLNHTQNITISQIAEHFNYSVSCISHLFKKVNGKSIPKYINCLRIDAAREMLMYSNATIQEISMSVGYSDSSYFSVIFKNETGLSPLNYRKVHR